MSDRSRQIAAPASLTLPLEGRARAFELIDCKVCLGGEFAGNVDLVLGCDEEVEAQLVGRLSVDVAGEPQPIDVIGSGPEENGKGRGFTFGTERLADLGEHPESITLLYEGREVATLPCRLWGSVPLDRSRFMDPTELLGRAVAPSFGPIRTHGRRGPVLSALGSGLLAAGSLIAWSGFRSDGLDYSSIGLVGGALIGLLGLVLLVVMLWPYREVRVDPTRGTVSEVRTRDLLWRSSVLEESRRDLSEFDHVRIIERIRLANDLDSHDQGVWYVILEGPIRWQDEDGVVHLRLDHLRLKEFSSDIAAHRFAAEVATATGLKILDTSDTGM
jgi:hypothetical protein